MCCGVRPYLLYSKEPRYPAPRYISRYGYPEYQEGVRGAGGWGRKGREGRGMGGLGTKLVHT